MRWMTLSSNRLLAVAFVSCALNASNIVIYGMKCNTFTWAFKFYFVNIWGKFRKQLSVYHDLLVIAWIHSFVHSFILLFFTLWAAKQRDFQADMQAKHIIYAKTPERAMRLLTILFFCCCCSLCAVFCLFLYLYLFFLVCFCFRRFYDPTFFKK